MNTLSIHSLHCYMLNKSIACYGNLWSFKDKVGIRSFFTAYKKIILVSLQTSLISLGMIYVSAFVPSALQTTEFNNILHNLNKK